MLILKYLKTMKNNIWGNKNIVDVLAEGSVVVMPTDTIYGIVGSALNKYSRKYLRY